MIDAMDAQSDLRLSREEYRAWVAQQPRGRFERIDGRVVKMAAERIAHVRAKLAICLAFRNAILAAGLRCEALTDGITVEVDDSDYEPDALVYCGERLDGNAIAAPSPIIIVEVLSQSTQSVDNGVKLADYFRLPSVMHYLIMHPTRQLIIHHRRRANEDGLDTALIRSGPLILDPPGCTIRLDDLYSADAG